MQLRQPEHAAKHITRQLTASATTTTISQIDKRVQLSLRAAQQKYRIIYLACCFRSVPTHAHTPQGDRVPLPRTGAPLVLCPALNRKPYCGMSKYCMSSESGGHARPSKGAQPDTPNEHRASPPSHWATYHQSTTGGQV